MKWVSKLTKTLNNQNILSIEVFGAEPYETLGIYLDDEWQCLGMH